MEKDKFFEQVKVDMEQILKEMNWENYIEKRTSMEQYFGAIEAMVPLRDSSEIVASPTVEKQNEKETEEKEERVKYQFERKLRGGSLKGLSAAFVPESDIRDLGIVHGDYLYATENGEFTTTGSKKYDYEIAERGNGKEVYGRIQYNHCPVKYNKELDRFYVDQAAGGEKIRIDEVAQELFIDEKDVGTYLLKEDDIIDIAFFENKSSEMKVIWKMRDENFVSEVEQRPQQLSSFYKKLKEKDEDGVTNELTEEEASKFKGKSILIVGFEPGKARFREDIEKRGGTFLWASGKESEDRFTAMIKKADCVICIKQQMRHWASITGNEYCKKWNIPFGSVDTLGGKSVIMEIDEAFKRQQIETA